MQNGQSESISTEKRDRYLAGLAPLPTEEVRKTKINNLYMSMFYAGGITRSIAPSLLGLVFILSITVIAANTVAQEDPLTNQGPVFEDPVRIVWEFGLQIQADANLNGITATVPIPLEWPEQTIIAEAEIKTQQVGKLRFTQPTKESRLLVFDIGQLGLGETAEVLIRFEMQKSMIVPPKQTDRLKIPDRAPTPVRTFLSPSPFIESKDRRILAIANHLKDESLDGWQQVESIYRWVRNNIEYVFDEEIRSCLEALESGRGDCEEMSSLFIAICRAMKIPARAVWIPEHTYPEFYLEDDQGNGYWFPCQVAGEYQFGGMQETRPVIHKGDRFRIQGSREPVRYLQPTLIERSGTGMVKMTWMMKAVEGPDVGIKRHP